jgi:DNA (cytosine-5)-methyltransferase 1
VQGDEAVSETAIEWRIVPMYPNYEVSTEGGVRRATRGKGTYVGRVLRTPIDAEGYPTVNLEGKPRRVHVLVAAAFCPEWTPDRVERDATVSRPRLLDLFCGAGGAGMGYHRAGFDVVGVDIRPQPRYPFAFVQFDALDALVPDGRVGSYVLADFDAIHASPPCQAYSIANRNNGSAHRHPALIEPVREALRASGLPYVIENVEGSPLLEAIKLCGASFGLGTPEMLLRRHRLFECSFPTGMTPPCSCGQKLTIGVYGNGTPSWHRKKLGRNVLAAEWREAMGIDWMVKTELAQAIPPAYCEHIGSFLLAEVQLRARVVA